MVIMVEIYSYEITTHERFARDQQEIEAFRKQYHIPPSSAGIVAIQTKILDFVPKHPALVLLMQTYQRKNWARFTIPQNYYLQRFTSSYIAPSLGSRDKQDADVYKIEGYVKQKTRRRLDRKQKEQQGRQQSQSGDDEEEIVQEGEALIKMLKHGVKETNGMIDYIVARMYQFIQA
jgi:hypothetical protein